MTDWGLIDPGAAEASGTDDDAILAALVEVERALLRAWGTVLDERLDAQSTALDASALDRETLRAGVVRDGVPVVALVPLLREQLEAAGHPAERLHLGATSQDIVDSALMLISRDALGAARESLIEVGHRLAAVADAERRSPRIARSLARHAEASTLGVLAAGWLDGVTSAIESVDGLVYPVQFGGAVGTGTVADAAAGRPGAVDEVRAELARR
ncbi:MAG: lyase family protein, partial [Actinomycetota bacterium]|nr:lyase family protein [Actinomycetota bacterium]